MIRRSNKMMHLQLTQLMAAIAFLSIIYMAQGRRLFTTEKDPNTSHHDDSNSKTGVRHGDPHENYTENLPQEIVLSKPDDPLQVSLVLLDDEWHNLAKRTSFVDKKSTWPHRIPYILDSSFSKALIPILQDVLKFIMNHLCVEYVHEQKFDSTNFNWFKENGYDTNAYLRFKKSAVCATVYGRGYRDAGPRDVRPCTQFFVMMHEVIHSLGGMHTMSYPFRERYITLHTDNINAVHNFKKANAETEEYHVFDASSLMMYARTYYTKTGLHTFDYIRPDMGQLTGSSTFKNIYLELNKNYKCAATKCANVDTDCGVGYLGYINKQCTCVCPTGFDPSKKCKSLLNAPDTSLKWPDGSFTMYEGKGCPDGMEESTISLPLPKNPIMNGIKLAYSKNLLKLQMCSKTSSTKSMETWPFGDYCIVKPKDASCTIPFKEGEFTIDLTAPPTISGNVGDVTVNGNQISIKYCCKVEGDHRFPIKLPTTTPFRLLTDSYYCQEVDGMWPIKGVIFVATTATKNGSTPNAVINKKGFRYNSCYYQPPTYGCSKEVTLDANTKSTTITIPMDGGSRAPNKRCFYFFKAAKGSQLRITFTKTSLYKYDKLLVKRFNLLQNPHRISIANPPSQQMISENNELFVEYWSHMKKSADYKGAEFTVDLIQEKDFCYNTTTQGADYAGKKDVAETYDECVAWKDATQCPDFPWNGTNGLHLLNSGKSCRNLDTVGMLQPWCYGYVNGTMCTRRYCDVCNHADAVDMVKGCADFIANDPTFCKEAAGRFGCFKSCEMDIATYDKSKVMCGKPAIPTGVTTSGTLKNSYAVGASISVTCGDKQSNIECTTLGWTPFDDSCSVTQCVDTSQLCKNAIVNFAQFCTNSKSKTMAAKYCKKSCGLCKAAKCSATSGSSYSLASGSKSSLTTGQNVAFTCKNGLYHTSGDLKRACSISGQLMGKEPVCKATPLPADVNLAQIYPMDKTLTKKTAVLMKGAGLEVPFNGKITKWYYFCKNAGKITLLVYRKTSTATSYTYVGSNVATCVLEWPWSYNVPSIDQISVQKGDLLGVYNGVSTVAYQACGKATTLTVLYASVKASSNVVFTSGTKTFDGRGCGFIGIGARVEPV